MSNIKTSRRQFLTTSAATFALTACGGSTSSSSNTGNDNSVDNMQPPVLEDPSDNVNNNPGIQRPVRFNEPRGLHVSIQSSVHEARTITWFTDVETGQAPIESFLQFGPVTDDMTDSDIQVLPLPSESLAVSSVTPGVSAFTFRATMNDIDNSLPIRYRVGSERGGWSDVKVIKPTRTDNWSFIHYGDQGVGPLAQLVVQQVQNNPTDLLMLAGDLSYADGNQPVWDDWFDFMEPVMAERITMAAPGNHENKDFGGAAFKNRFSHPEKPLGNFFGSNDPGSSFYSFRFNRVHFLVSTAGAFIEDGTLAEELINIEYDLSQAAAARAAGEIDFIIIMQHYTIFTDQEGRGPFNPSLVALQEQMIARYGVDSVIVGHDHIYQRSKPMNAGIETPEGYVQVLAGTGGQSIRLIGGNDFDDPGVQPWSAKAFEGIGYVKYDVEPGKIKAQYFGAPPLSRSEEGRSQSTGIFELVDEFTLTARPKIACQNCALPPRSSDELLKDYELIATNVRMRNHKVSHGC